MDEPLKKPPDRKSIQCLSPIRLLGRIAHGCHARQGDREWRMAFVCHCPGAKPYLGGFYSQDVG